MQFKAPHTVGPTAPAQCPTGAWYKINIFPQDFHLRDLRFVNALCTGPVTLVSVEKEWGTDPDHGEIDATLNGQTHF